MRIIKDGQDNDLLVLPSWNRSYFGNICYPEGSPELNEIVSAYIPARESSLFKLVELKERIGRDGLDLLWHLLNLNPNERMSAELALSHKFFDSVRESSQE